jgi:hypothetical protein
MKFQSTIPFRTLVPVLFLLAGILTSAAQSGTLRFSASSYSGKESAGAIKVTVSRSGGTSGTLAVDFATVDSGGGTAEPEGDYYPTNGTLTFGPGVRSLFFYVPLIDDEAHEESETVLIDITGSSVVEGIASTTVTIADDDSCSYAVGTNKVVFASSGGSAERIVVTATTGCSWTAVNSTAGATWLGIVSGASGTGNGEVVVSCDPNEGSTARTAKLNIAGKVVTVTQLPEPPPDETAPTVSITSPALNGRVTNDTITVTGRASDNVAVTLVEARLENEFETSDYIPADGTANWSVALAGLVPGTNTIRVRARDASNEPTEVTRTVVYVEVSPISLVVNGSGTVKPLVDGALLDVGKSYTVQATPARGNEFAGWTGYIESTANPFTFTMQTGFVLQANFRVIPFIAVAGVYEGLCYDAEVNRHASAGFLSVKSTEAGAYSARLTLGGVRYSFSGKFAADGIATNSLPRAGTNALTLILAIDLANGSDQITGSVSDGDWTASVLCDRVLFNKKSNPAPQAGKYTMVIPADDEDPAAEPAGFSYGTVNVDAAGKVKLSASLADGTKISQSANLSKIGYWPLYVPLYSGRGSVLSWVVFAESSEASFTGELNWVKPVNASDRLYPNGFAVRHELMGSSYFAPTNVNDPVLNFSAGKVRFSAGNLAEEFSNDISLVENKVTNLGTNKLNVSINLSSGLFTGSVTPPGGSQPVPFRGAVHQKQNQGWGFFLGTNQSGRVRLSE